MLSTFPFECARYGLHSRGREAHFLTELPERWGKAVASRQVGGSGAFTELAAQPAEAIFASEKPSLAAAQAYYSHIKDRAVAHERTAESLKVLPGLQPMLGASQKEADELLAEMTQLHHPLATSVW